MADLPDPVDMTASVSRPARTASIASRCPGRRASKPNASRATRSIRSVGAAIAAGIPAATAQETRTADEALDGLCSRRVSATQPWSGRRLHFVGIGGDRMSGLALVAQSLGAQVTGSDRAAGSPYTGPLQARGIEPVIGHDAGNVPADAEVVVSSAIPPENPERAVARGRGQAELHRADLLGDSTRLKPTIAISGTHGKTTTSSMVVHALRGCGLDPSYLVGGEVRSTGANAGWGTGAWLVVEADESDRSLLKLEPRIAVLTNAELDHHATYASQRDVEATFAAFLA